MELVMERVLVPVPEPVPELAPHNQRSQTREILLRLLPKITILLFSLNLSPF